MTDWCEENECRSYAQLVERFGTPQEVAMEFLAQQDAWVVNRYAYTRLKSAYASLAVLIVAVVIAVGLQAKNTLSPTVNAGICYTQPILHNNGVECEMFWVKTKFRGDDCYWEYHSCTELMYLIGKPASADGTEPYAEELYINGKDGVSHWRFNDLHHFWVKVRDDDS